MTSLVLLVIDRDGLGRDAFGRDAFGSATGFVAMGLAPRRVLPQQVWLPDGFGSVMGSAVTCSDAMGLAAADLAMADAAGGPSMQIIMQFLLQFVKDFLMDDGWSQIPSTEINNQPFGIPRRADLHLCYGQYRNSKDNKNSPLYQLR